MPPVIDTWKCTGCEVCIQTCPNDSLMMDEGKPVLNPDGFECDGCGSCVEECPEEAITII